MVWPTRLRVGSNEPWRGFAKLAEELLEECFDSPEIETLPPLFFFLASEVRQFFLVASLCPMEPLIFAWSAAFLHLIFSIIETEGTGMGTWLLGIANCTLLCLAVLSCLFLAWHTCRRFSINSNFLAIVLLLPVLELLQEEVVGEFPCKDLMLEVDSLVLPLGPLTGDDLMWLVSSKISTIRAGSSLTSPEFTKGTFKSKHEGNSIQSSFTLTVFKSIVGKSLQGFFSCL